MAPPPRSLSPSSSLVYFSSRSRFDILTQHRECPTFPHSPPKPNTKLQDVPRDCISTPLKAQTPRNCHSTPGSNFKHQDSKRSGLVLSSGWSNATQHSAARLGISNNRKTLKRSSSRFVKALQTHQYYRGAKNKSLDQTVDDFQKVNDFVDTDAMDTATSPVKLTWMSWDMLN
ncbi:hypothetical protein B0H19DRAFT_1230261 [Mycena capillaripes]|nr:hypothetical protein B0H19DRAFT_1230261 [Mycena capillaripes]